MDCKAVVFFFALSAGSVLPYQVGIVTDFRGSRAVDCPYGDQVHCGFCGQVPVGHIPFCGLCHAPGFGRGHGGFGRKIFLYGASPCPGLDFDEVVHSIGRNGYDVDIGSHPSGCCVSPSPLHDFPPAGAQIFRCCLFTPLPGVDMRCHFIVGFILYCAGGNRTF